MNFELLAAVPILIISYSGISKGYVIAVYWLNILQSSLNILHNDLTYFMKNNTKKCSSSSSNFIQKRKFNIEKKWK